MSFQFELARDVVEQRDAHQQHQQRDADLLPAACARSEAGCL